MTTRTNRPALSTQRGSTLLTVVLITFALAGLSIGMLTESIAEKGLVTLRHDGLRALECCEAGAIKSSLEIRAQRDSGDDGIGAVSGEYGGGSFAVSAVQSTDNPDRWTLTAVGTYRGVTKRVEIGVRRRASGDYIEGLFAKDTLTFNGRTQTDAYDSRLGNYDAQAIHSDSAGPYAEGGGDVGSNAGIVLHGSSVAIRGNAIPGPAQAVTMTGNPIVWGDVLPRRVLIDLQPATYGEFEAAYLVNANAELQAPAATGGSTGSGGNGNGKGNGNGGNGNGNGGGGDGTVQPVGQGTYDPATMALSAGGQDEVHLAGGTYFFSSVRLTGQARLFVDGPSTIYVLGDLDVSGGGFVNATGRPADLLVFAHPYAIGGMAPASSQVKIRGGSQAAMALYAPGADLSVHGGDHIYGSFVANTITIAGDTSFHYDRSMGEKQGHTAVILERLYWRDLDERIR